jgi:hypothetical protein
MSLWSAPGISQKDLGCGAASNSARSSSIGMVRSALPWMKRMGACTRAIFERELKLRMSSGPSTGRIPAAASGAFRYQDRRSGSRDLLDVLRAVRDAAAPRRGDVPAVIPDVVRKVEPDIGGAEKIHGPGCHEFEGESGEGDDQRPGDIPGDAQHEITVAFRDTDSTRR